MEKYLFMREKMERSDNKIEEIYDFYKFLQKNNS